MVEVIDPEETQVAALGIKEHLTLTEGAKNKIGPTDIMSLNLTFANPLWP